MRRYRFGRIAALFAAIYVAAVIVSGVRALATGDPALLREIVTGGWDPDFMPYTWWVELLMVAGGVLQGWAYWQVLRGRPAGTAAADDRPVRLLRAALYLSVACTLLYRLPIPYLWWLGLPSDLLNLAVVGLFFVVLAGALPRWLRLLGLVAGLASAAMGVASTVAYGLGQYSVVQFVAPYQLGNAVYLLWLVPVLAGQARDGRWRRGTVRMGGAWAALSLLSSGSHSIVAFGGWGVDYDLVLLMVLSVLDVFGTVWQARSAHDLGGPPPVPSPAPPVRLAPARAWPLAAVAVVVPLIPAAVNLADGMPVWTGPRGAVDDFFHGYVSYPATVLWVAGDMLIGVGAPAVLVLIAVVRRTRRLLRATMLILTLAAAAGVVTSLTTNPEADRQLIPETVDQRLALYPDGLFDRNENGDILFGLSPLWYSAALAASALILLALYGAPPAARLRHHVLVTALATSVALCFVPAADQSRGPVTTAEDCSPPERWDTDGRPVEPPPRTGSLAFICAVRQQNVLTFAATTPDQVLLAHGRRLCAVYTRKDPRELARLREVEGVNVGNLSGVLAGICPAAKAEVSARAAADNREFEEFLAEEQRKCDATPRHHPLIKPAKAIRLKEPEWPEAGLGLYEDVAGEGRSASAGPVTAGPGRVTVDTHSDFHVCVTLETYPRRPPVETKGWDDVVEVGYANQSGRMSFMDGLSGIELPDLSLNGRKGHYRIRVHFAWFPWKGEEYGTQRLLIMAYPGPGDEVVTYRRPTRRR
ncbi:DMT family transporter [Nonomuraea rhodomycinica]|uniref:DMT family transporter n=1 Tax=Nonomuraea rhodomycinica TaxID=1712872 RepID=A0A7Y6IS26_9ACTN|nr:DMT family transporter [Nonomuraea rhodomycinica]NUW43362.1 DMT family transporter [Nonomuraea rhodomycinica]